MPLRPGWDQLDFGGVAAAVDVLLAASAGISLLLGLFSAFLAASSSSAMPFLKALDAAGDVAHQLGDLAATNSSNTITATTSQCPNAQRAHWPYSLVLLRCKLAWRGN